MVVEQKGEDIKYDFDLDLQINEMFHYEGYFKYATTWDKMHTYTEAKKMEVLFPFHLFDLSSIDMPQCVLVECKTR